MQKEEAFASTNYALSDEDIAVIESLLKKADKAATEIDHFSVVKLSEICDYLNEAEVDQLKRVYSIDPTEYGFRKPQVGIESVPSEMVALEPQAYKCKGKELFTNAQYIPKQAFDAFMLMNQAMKRKTGKELLIESCYRSNAYRALFFLKVLHLNDYDIEETVQYAAIPGYSEHGTPSKLAFDFMTQEGVPYIDRPEKFEETEEYEWLMRNAFKYDFYLTYPEDNTYGVLFEPWHWRHIPPAEDIASNENAAL